MKRLALLLALVLAGAQAASAQPVNAPTTSVSCNASAIYDASTLGATELVAAVSGRTIYICGYVINGGGTAAVKLVTGTGTACATGAANITPAYSLVAQTNIEDNGSFFRGLKGAPSAAVCINSSAAVAVQAIVYYGQY